MTLQQAELLTNPRACAPVFAQLNGENSLALAGASTAYPAYEYQPGSEQRVGRGLRD